MIMVKTNSNKAVIVENLNKTFSVRERTNKTIRDSLLRFYQQKGERRHIKALDNINFSVKEGEFFGIIGRNGSGKSTLLKILIEAYRPDKGSKIITNGKMIRLALGLGFDKNLSARDNIYINGSVLGLSFKKIGKIFDTIIEFSELKNFVDTPIKHYSSGMEAKLKFAIAIHAEADIFLMDELFGGVGDVSFQKKSQKVFKETILNGRTIILVSHNKTIVQEFCHRVLLLDRGKQIAIGPPSEIIPMYEKLFDEEKTTKQEVSLAKRQKVAAENKAKKQEAILVARQKVAEERKAERLRIRNEIYNLKQEIKSLKFKNKELEIKLKNKSDAK